MLGHQPIIAARMRGLTPSAAVFVSTSPVNPRLQLHRWSEQGLDPQVVLQPQDVPELLDWRFMVGLRAIVDGWDRDRVLATCRAIREAGAASVVGSVSAEHADAIEILQETDL